MNRGSPKIGNSSSKVGLEGLLVSALFEFFFFPQPQLFMKLPVLPTNFLKSSVWSLTLELSMLQFLKGAILDPANSNSPKICAAPGI